MSFLSMSEWAVVLAGWIGIRQALFALWTVFGSLPARTILQQQ